MTVSKIGIGTVQFGLNYGISNKFGKTDFREVKSILDVAGQSNIDTIDTASGYGDSEKVLGQNELKNFKIVSKFKPPVEDNSITNQIENSLKQLNIPQFYGYLAHRPMDLILHPAQWEELKTNKENKRVEKIGFSLNEPIELETLLNNDKIPDIVQVPYNYFDKRFEPYFENLKSLNCEVHSRSAFLQGLFFVPANQQLAFFDFVKPFIRNLQLNYGNKLPLLLLKFCIANSLIDKVIIGINNASQLIENLKSQCINETLPEFNEPIPDNILMPSKWKL